MDISIRPIATMRSDFPSKFGIPRQSGLVKSLRSTIVFEPEFRNPDALRGLEDFSHIWLIWQFSKAVRTEWTPTVRPPRLGGNARMGVFATRSPFRPNALGLSCVEIISIEQTPENGTVIHVAGADLMDGTPIFDIKPYIPYADCKPDASDGFLSSAPRALLSVDFENCNLYGIEPTVIENIKEIISEDPRPAYQNEPDRIYKMLFSGYQTEFTVHDGVAHIKRIYKEKK